MACRQGRMFLCCADAGATARRFDVSKPAPYSRLVSHLHRVWDYKSCPEAQLKVWLAYHLLAKENTGVLCGLLGNSSGSVCDAALEKRKSQTSAIRA